MKSHLLSYAKFLIGWPLSLIALFFIVRLVTQQKLSLTLFSHVNFLFIILSLCCFLMYFIFRVLFWQFLTKERGVTVSFANTAYLWSTSELKRYVPGSIWSFMSRAQSYEPHNLSKKSVAQLLGEEILFVTVSCFIISLISADFVFYGIFPRTMYTHIFIALFIILILGLGGLVLVSPIFVKKIPLLKTFVTKLDTKKIILLFSFMFSAFLFFGLGTYCAVSSLSILYFPHILSLSAFFVFTYIGGYLAFITPMGLGVREGLMTIGLSKYIPAVEAAQGAILSRILLIISELLFLGFAWLWLQAAKTKFVKTTEHFFKTYPYEIFLSISVVLYSLYFYVTSYLRYVNFYTGRFDLGNMDQTVWNTIHGRIFQLTNPDGTNIISRLAFHADFMLVLLSPFYYIWQDPRMLLFIQTIALASGAVFIYLIAKHILKQKSISFVFALIYLLHPAIDHANLFDFHAVTLAVPLLLAGWFAIQKKHYILATILLILAGTTKEEIWIVIGMFGIVFMLQKQRVLGAFLTIFSFAVFYYIFFKAIPQAHGGNHFALSYYSDFGSTPGGVIKNIFFSPLKTVSTVMQNGRLWYLFEIFFPFAFLSIFSPLFLLFSGPDFAVSLLSQNTQLHNIYFHYASITIPFAFLSSLYGVAFLKNKFPKLSFFYVSLLLVVTSLTAAYWYGPLPGAKNMNHDMYTNQLQYRGEVDDFLQTIPRRYSVAATNNVGSHLSHRQRIYTIPLGMDKADVIVFLLNDQFAQPSLEAQKEFAQTLSNDPHYIKAYEYQAFVLFVKKGLPLRPLRKSKNFTPPVFH